MEIHGFLHAFIPISNQPQFSLFFCSEMNNTLVFIESWIHVFLFSSILFREKYLSHSNKKLLGFYLLQFYISESFTRKCVQELKI